MLKRIAGFLRDRSLAWQLSLVMSVAAFTVILIGLVIFNVHHWNETVQDGDRQLLESARVSSALLDAYYSNSTVAVHQNGVRLSTTFNGRFEVKESAGSSRPELWYDGAPLVGRNSLIEDFAQTNGGTGSIFLRVGDDFERVVTTNRKADGTPAVGSLLGPNHPATRALLDGKTYFGPAKVVNSLHFSQYNPVIVNGRVIGALGTGFNSNQIFEGITTALRPLRPLGEGHVYVIVPSSDGKNGVVNTSASEGVAPDWQSREFADILEAALRNGGSGVYEIEGQHSLGTLDKGDLRVAAYWNQNWGAWAIAVVSEEVVIAEAVSTTRWLVTGGLVLVLVLIAGTIYSARQFVNRPIRKLIRELAKFSRHDFSQPLHVDAEGEIGHLARSMEQFRVELVAALTAVRTNAGEVASASRHIAEGSKTLNLRTAEQIDLLKYTFTSMDELNEKVAHNAQSAGDATALATKVSQMAGEGGTSVAQIVRTMEEIDEGARTIEGIISVIDGIAFQTNILALNAAVEAARAGDHGRGFAVVASEVRSLAQRSAAAAKEIKTLIHDSVDRVARGVQLVDHAGRSIVEVVQATRKVSDLISEVQAASATQSRSVEQVAEAVRALDRSTQQNVRLVGDSASSAESLRHQAELLREATSSFQLSVQEQMQALATTHATAPARATPAPAAAPEFEMF